MKRTVLLLALVLLCNFVFAQDFRNVTWGAMSTEVKDSEAWELSTEGEFEGSTLLSFSGKVSNLTTDAYYEIDPEKGLVRAGYLFTEPHVNDNAFIEDFEKVKGILTRVYGAPTNTYDNWSDGLYRDRPERYGMAVAAGHVSFSALWETDRTSIMQLLSGDNFDINHTAIYTSLAETDTLNQKLEDSEDDAF